MSDSASKDVLLVDDNAADVELALRAFDELKMPRNIVVARDGLEALEQLGLRGGPKPLPALILLDLQMPRLDGFGVLAKLRADPKFADVFVAVLTSSSRDEDRQEALRLGANRYIEKPMEFDGFVDILGELLTIAG